MNAPRILVVEDNPTARKLFCLILQTEGYRVVEAGDARTALQRIREDAPALILQDLLLPDLNGLELLKQIRALPGGTELPVIALSGFPSILDEARVLPLGFDATLVKPVDQASLLAAVKALLPERALARAPHGNGRRVLLVDDDPVQAKLVRLRLAQLGFVVTTAASAARALALAEQTLPEVVLSDVLMPEMDGFELCAELRARPRHAQIPVVLMSAHFRDEHDRRLAERVGAHSLVLRTPDLGDVLSAVHAALSEQPAAAPVEFPSSEHKARLVHRLDQLVGLNAALLRRASQQAAQLSIVGGVADALARSVNVDHALHDVLAACLDAGGVSRGVLFREDETGAFAPEQCVGFADDEREALAGMFGDPTLFALLQRGKPFGLSTIVKRLESAWFCAQCGLTSAVVVPILLESECGAALLLGSAADELGEDELIVFGRAVGAYVAQALELSGAFRRLKAAANADRVLFASLSVDEILRSLASLALGSLGDWCVIDLIDEGQVLRPALALHADPARLALVQELERRYPPRPESSPRYGVLATRQACAFSVTDALRVAGAQDAEHLRLLRELGLKGQIVAPLMHNARLLGVLSVGRSGADRRPGKLDLALAEQLAARAGLALENARLYASAQLASRSKDEFLATVSHELRTPLHAMLAWADLLRAGDLTPDKQRHGFEVIARNAKAQAKLIDDILDVSRIVAGKLNLEVQSSSLLLIVVGALDSLRLSLDAKQLELELDVDPALMVQCDPERIRQVVWNLLSNAIKFTPRGGSIALGASQAGSSVVLSVKDSGEGIQREFIERVFERFQQADGRFARAHGGLGLGLAISRHIVELHGGTIEAFSEGPGKGSLFRVTLPQSELSSPRSPSAAQRRQRLSEPPAAPSELVGLRVLVVDDEPDARDLLVTVFERSGAAVVTAGSYSEALARLAQSKHDVLVSDIGMPGEDGIALIRTIRAMPPEQGGLIPALALSAYARSEDKNAALLAGYQIHVAKPFESSEFMAAMQKLARIAAQIEAVKLGEAAT